MPTTPTPHDHAQPVETLDEKAARLTAEQSAAPSLIPFPPHVPGFLLNCPGGRELAVKLTTLADGRPALELCTGGSDVGYAEADVPLDQLEEVIAGLRDMARQAGGLPGRPLTAEQLDQAREALPQVAVITAAALPAQHPCGHARLTHHDGRCGWCSGALR